MKTIRMMPLGAALVAVSLFTGPAQAAISSQKVQIPVTDTVHDVDSISGWLYADFALPNETFPAVVLMHGCTGIWSSSSVPVPEPASFPNLQNQIEKWAMKLAAEGYVALVVDSFTDRRNMSYTSLQWQKQCNSPASAIPFNLRVDPYTTRANDARSAYDYLVSQSFVDATNIGLLGWSAGAEATMVQLAQTPRNNNVLRPASELVFQVGVAFYPGCGTALGFSYPGNGYWRPYVDLRMNHGTGDSLYANCGVGGRMGNATNNLGATAGSGREAVLDSYTDAKHSFDGGSEAWPVSKCDPYVNNDNCAMRDADIDSLQFLDDHLK